MNESLREFCQRIKDVVIAAANGEPIEGAIAGDWLEAQDGWLGFRKDCQYREKHSTFKVNGFVIPEPETNEPDANTIFYTPDIIATCMVRVDIWGRTHDDLSALRRGLLHLSERNAVMHAKALLGINPYQVGE